MIKRTILIVLYQFATVSVASDAEVYWVEYDGENKIMVADNLAGQWSDPREIYASNNALTSLAVASNDEGGKLLVWSEQRKSKTVLKQSTYGANSNTWSLAQLLTDKGQSNMASVLISKGGGTVWLIWSSDRDGLDDVYASERKNGASLSVNKVHEENDVPDVLPTARINEKGDIELNWLRYSRNQRGYVATSGLIKIDIVDERTINESKSANHAVRYDQEVAAGRMKFPSFVNDNPTAVLHFPTHYYIQSTRINGSL
jgi:hypothetical protein